MGKRGPKKGTGGAPTKYKEEFCQEMIEFFDMEPFTDVKIPHYKDGKVVWNDIKRMPNKLPTMVEFVRHLNREGYDVGYATVYDWLNVKHASFKKKFSETFTCIAKDLQKNGLLQNALMGLYNPLFAKFTAINITDMVDKKEIDHSGKIAGSGVNIVIVTSDQPDQPVETNGREIVLEAVKAGDA